MKYSSIHVMSSKSWHHFNENLEALLISIFKFEIVSFERILHQTLVSCQDFTLIQLCVAGIRCVPRHVSFSSNNFTKITIIPIGDVLQIDGSNSERQTMTTSVEDTMFQQSKITSGVNFKCDSYYFLLSCFFILFVRCLCVSLQHDCVSDKKLNQRNTLKSSVLVRRENDRGCWRVKGEMKTNRCCLLL